MCLTHSRRHENIFGQKPCKDMDFETFKRILNVYKNALVVTLTGNGEPLMNDDFFKMVEFASKEMKMYVYSATNGTLIGKHKENIVDSYLSLISISVNGHNVLEFSRLTGLSPEYFDLIVKNTKELVELRNKKRNTKLKIWATIILDNKNYFFLTEMINFASFLGVDCILFLPFLASPKEGFRAEERCLFSDDVNVLDKFKEAGVMMKRLKMKVILPPLLDREKLKYPNKFKRCKVPFYNLTVDGEGNIGGCSCQLLDNSKNGKFYDSDAWNNSYFRDLRGRFLISGAPVLEPCVWCYRRGK